VREAAVRVSARLSLSFEDAQTARAVAAAARLDNPQGGVDQETRGATVTVRVGAASARSVRETLDDWLRCAGAAESSARAARR
jgi:hypothetical protein